MSVIGMNQFRQPLVNKRDNYIEYGSNGILPEKLDPKNGSNSVTPRYYAILNECIWEADESNFIDIKYGNDINNLTRLDPSHYEVNSTTAVIKFEEGYTINEPHYAFYKAGGSIIWVEDVNSLQKACTDIDNYAVYKDGSTVMNADLDFGNNNIIHVTKVDGIILRNHSHTNMDGDAPQIAAEGLATKSVETSKLDDYAVTEIKIGTDAVITDKIMDYNVTLNKLDDNSVDNSKILNNTIENIKLKDATIEYTKLNINPSNYNNVLKGIFNVMYPVGAIYITTADSCPIASYVGTWSKVSSGKVLQGADNDHAAGTSIAAGLPNITGNLSCVTYQRTWQGNGAFATGGTLSNAANTAGASGSFAGLSFNAANGEVHNGTYRNDIYGKSDTVQPPAYVVNIFRRTA